MNPPGTAFADPDEGALRAAVRWDTEGHRSWLATVLATYGSAPRQPGAMAVVRDDGRIAGSVSGGCVEDDLAAWLARDSLGALTPRRLVYGRDAEERARLRLPCGGALQVWLEPVHRGRCQQLLDGIGQGRPMRRTIDLRDGHQAVAPATPADTTGLAGDRFVQVVGPCRRLLLVGANDISALVAPLAVSLGFAVTVIDPREEYADLWPAGVCPVTREMPDDAIAARRPDGHTAVVALSHDPRLDDLAMLEALGSPAFYVGAMGSARTTAARRERLALFDLASDHLARLQGPVGMSIGARTPPEIAVAIAAELVRRMRLPPGSGPQVAGPDTCAISQSATART